MVKMAVFLVGYIKTSQYKPNIPSEWDNVNTLQNEVAFGIVVSPEKVDSSLRLRNRLF